MEEDAEQAPRPRPRARLVAAGLLLLLVLAVAILWTQRAPIAADFIDRELARRGVAASYQVTRIGLRTQRLEKLVIGDPRNPDLTAALVQIELSLGLRAPRIDKITARGVRLHGRVVGNKVSFGSVDRLLPPPTGKPFALPDQRVEVADVAIRLDTPSGRIAVALAGAGNLASGFAGRLMAAAPRLRLPGCTVARPRANVTIAVAARRPSIAGPIAAARMVCADAKLDLNQPRAVVDANFSETLTAWIGDAALQARGVRFGDNRVAGVSGNIAFDGTLAQTRGAVDIAAAQGAIAGFRAARLALEGRYAGSLESGKLSMYGGLVARGARAEAAIVGPVTTLLAAAGGTPVGPLGGALATAVARAASGFDADAGFRLVTGGGGGAIRIERLRAASRSGARLALAGGEGFTSYWALGRTRLDGEFALSGGGFPAAQLSLDQPADGGPVRGTAQIAPFAAGGARLALAPIRFTAAAGDTRIDTVATLSGPFKDGRVDGLVLPIGGRFGGGGFAFGERCTLASFRALSAAGLRLGPARLPLCPIGRAMVWRAGGGPVQGGAEVRAPRLAGRLGASPISLAASRVRFALAEPGFSSAEVAIRLGNPGFVNRLDLASLAGRFTPNGVVGSFAGGDGQIGNVPLLLSNAGGRWSVLRGDVSVDGAVTVADADAEPRFYPLVSNDFRLTLANQRIDAAGWLNDPGTGTRVTRATITHHLPTGAGGAVLEVPGIAFTENFQPEALTRLTTGVVALVRGTVTGTGRIDWSRAGATSTGSFATEKMDLAAAFGPVTGLSTRIRFSDLLGLETAPGQLATVDLIQTGIDVVDGSLRYQLLPGLRVRVEAGRWPYAGGELLLEETILDFSQPSAKRLTFRVIGLDAAAFVQEFKFSNISATGTFDGVIPMIFDTGGGRIVGGRLVARPAGGTLSYIGELSDKALGTYGKLAFDALKSLRYDKLIINLDGSLDGEFVAAIDLDGIATNTAPLGGIAGAVIQRLARIPFEFNITIRGPFRALIGTARSLEDPSLLIEQALPEDIQNLIETKAVQTQESETVQ